MDETEHSVQASPPSRLRRASATILLALLAVPWFVWGPLGPTLYLGGLFNSILIWSPIALVLVVLLPLILLNVLARPLLTYTFTPGRRPSPHRETILVILVVGGLVGPILVGLTGLTPSPGDLFVRGFTRYAQRRVEVEAIQSWLDSLNPREYVLGESGTVVKRFVGSEQPPCIATLHPTRVTVRPDDSKHLTVTLLWGGGFIGHWGLVVGPRDMSTAAPGSSELPKPRSPLAPGAYIWSSD